MGGDLLGQKEVVGEDFFSLLVLSTRGAMATADAAGAAASLMPSTLCEDHNKPLKFFCQNELALICAQCAKTKKHYNHTVLPIQEAAQKNKVSEGSTFPDNFGISFQVGFKRGETLQEIQAWNSGWEVCKMKFTYPAGSKLRKAMSLCEAP